MKTEIVLKGPTPETKTIDLPTSWHNVTYGQFLKVQDLSGNIAGIISLFTGISEEQIRVAKIQNLDAIILAMGFLNTEPPNTKPLKILGYDIPADLGFETIAQFEDLKDTLKKAKDMSVKDHLNNYPIYCAIYACKEYDWKKAEAMAHEFLNAPCPEVLGIGNFTLAKLIGLTLSTGQNSQKPNTPWKKFKQVLTAFRIRLVFMVRFFTWRKKPVTVAKNS